MASKRKKADPNETAEQKFVRLANMRVNRTLRALEGIGKLGAKSYKSTAEQRNKIESVINEAVTEAKERLQGGAATQAKFRL